MAHFDFSEATPFKAIHVGEYIKDELDARGMQQKELAKMTGIQASVLNDIIKGKRDLTAEHSVLIGKSLGINDDFFYDLQKQYDMDRARLSERVAQQAAAITIWNVLKQYISERFFKKMGVLTSDIKKDVETIFEIFGVKNLDEFLVLQEQESRIAYYKKSEKLVTNETDLFSWKYYSMYVARKKQMSAVFDKKNIDPLCEELNAIFAENIDVVRRTELACEKVGIKFLTVKKEGQVPVDGMSFWQGENPTVVLTMRRGTIDNFAFAMMHELGHIVLHLNDGGKVFVNISDEVMENIYEKEADGFAREKLIPADKWKSFRQRTKNVSPYRIQPHIRQFSEENGINAQVVLGRYMFDTHCYNVKSTFGRNIN